MTDHQQNQQSNEQQKTAQEIQAFEDKYQPQTKEIIIVTASRCGGAGRKGGETLWTESREFIAYIDCDTQQLIEAQGRVEWLSTEDERRRPNERFNIQPLQMYHLKVRTCKQPNDFFYIPFMLLEILSSEVENEQLQQVLEEYLTPVFIEDDLLGKLELNKDLDLYGGYVDWLGEEIGINIDGTDELSEKLAHLKSMIQNAADWDKKMRHFCAEKLTEDANAWQESIAEGEIEDITTEEFIKRISLSELAIIDDGEFAAYYHDDDMFFGHIIIVYGQIDGVLTTADIAG